MKVLIKIGRAEIVRSFLSSNFHVKKEPRIKFLEKAIEYILIILKIGIDEKTVLNHLNTVFKYVKQCYND